jgi:cytochrome c-type biogenesis protein CcmE
MSTPALGRSPSMRSVRHGRLLLVGTLALGGAVLAVALGLSEPKPIYARTVSELALRPSRGTCVRIQGMLVPGTLCKVDGKCEFRLRLTDFPSQAAPARSELEVRYAGCVIPDTVRDVPGLDVEITAEGELCDECAHFEATQFFAKCPSKYEMIDGGHQIAATPVRSCSELAQSGTRRGGEWR